MTFNFVQCRRATSLIQQILGFDGLIFLGRHLQILQIRRAFELHKFPGILPVKIRQGQKSQDLGFQ